MSIQSEINRINSNIANAYDELETKGATMPQTENSNNLATTIASIPSGGGTVEPEEKDVNFYDYDGTRVYSYTASEFANLTEMPENPSHDGLTAQGWNWSLSDAKTYVAEYGELEIGQLYVTDDNSTRLYIEIPTNNFGIQTNIYSSSTITIDWGDGSPTETKTTGYKRHTYSNKGKYVIKMTCSGNLTFDANTNYGSYIITKQDPVSVDYNRPFLNTLKKIEFGNNVSLRNYSFSNLKCLETIVGMPINTTIPDNCFVETTNLKCFIVKNGVTSLGSTLIQSSNVKLILSNTITTVNSSTLNQYSHKISLPSSLTSIGMYGMSNANSIPYLKIPASVNTISMYAFNGSYGPAYFDFSHHTSIPSLGDSGFGGIKSFQKIVVPDSLYENWIVETNWSTYANNIVKKSEAGI